MPKIFAALARNEMRGFFRNKVAAFWSLAFPLFLFSVLFLLQGADSLGSARIEVVDAARNGQSKSAIERIRDEGRSQRVIDVVVQEVPQTLPRHADAVRVVIPEAFGAPDAPPVLIDEGQSRSPAGQAAARLAGQALMKAELARVGASAPIIAVSAAESHSAASHGQYLLGGVLVMMMMSTGLMSTTAVLAAMREHDVFRVYGCLPVPRMHFLMAILSVRLVLVLAFTALLLAVGRFVFGIPVEIGAVRTSLMLLTAAAGGVGFLALGLLLGARVNTIATGTIVANLVYFPLLMLGDLTFPLQGLPDQAKAVLSLIPVNQLAAAMRSLLFQTPDAEAVLRLCAGLFVGSAILLAAASRLFRWSR